jgi:hypothetical protein
MYTQKYTVYYWNDADLSESYRVDVAADTLPQVAIHHLKPSTKYVLRVGAADADAHGPLSAETHIVTHTAAPTNAPSAHIAHVDVENGVHLNFTYSPPDYIVSTLLPTTITVTKKDAATGEYVDGELVVERDQSIQVRRSTWNTFNSI